MIQSDLPHCMRIACEGWDKFAGQIAQPEFMEMFTASAWRPTFYIAELDGQPIGMAGWNASWLTYGIYNLFWVAVETKKRGTGIGKALVNRCLDDLRPIADAVMLMTNVPEFYARHWGFKPIADIKTAENYGDTLMLLNTALIAR